jgi:hypothetical protein
MADHLSPVIYEKPEGVHLVSSPGGDGAGDVRAPLRPCEDAHPNLQNGAARPDRVRGKAFARLLLSEMRGSYLLALACLIIVVIVLALT